MMQTIVGGSTITDLYTDGDGFTWHIMQRDGESVCLYATRRGEGCCYVHFDSMDDGAPTPAARILLDRLPGVADAISALLAVAPTPTDKETRT